MLNPDDGSGATGRYERKFVLEEAYLSEVLRFLENHPARFRTLHPGRRVNNVYFDDHGLESYLDSIQGVSSRYKLRARWYGDNIRLAERPVYEIKKKQGLLGWKFKYPLEDFQVSPAAVRQVIRQAGDTGTIPPFHLNMLRRSAPVLLNSCSRKYLASADGNYRLTLDTDHRIFDVYSMQCCELAQMTHAGPGRVIMEIKYLPEYDDALEGITNAFPYRLSKSSKYVDGVHRLYL